MKHILTAVLIAAAIPAHAGGPVITEDMTETAPIRGHSFKDAVPFIIAAIVVAGLVLGNNGGTTCHSEEPVPTPDEGC